MSEEILRALISALRTDVRLLRKEKELFWTDSKRLDAMDKWTIPQWEDFYDNPLEDEDCFVRDVIDKLENF